VTRVTRGTTSTREVITSLRSSRRPALRNSRNLSSRLGEMAAARLTSGALVAA
jgi:hypothetical protein